jgi:hypothetical protein
MRGHCPRFDQGATLRFGAIEISQRGLGASLPGQTPWRLPWAAIAAYRLERGMLVVEAADRRRFHLSTSRIPNLPVLLHVIEQLAPRRGPAARPPSK